MQKCPYCAEDIQDEAIKCKHCGEFLTADARLQSPKEKLPWYFGTPFIVLMFCSVGPLALPLVWLRPRTTLAWKIGATALVVVLTIALVLISVETYRVLKEYYRTLNELMGIQ